MLYEFELCHRNNQKPFIVQKLKVKFITVTKWFKKFYSVSKNPDDQTKSGWPKCVNSEAVLQTIEANAASRTQRLSGELGISQSSVVHLHNLKLCVILPKYYKTFGSLSYIMKDGLRKILKSKIFGIVY